jgi:hypothetical protein
MANISGTIDGIAKVGSLSGKFSAKPSEIQRIVMTGDGKADFELRSGDIQKGVSQISTTTTNRNLNREESFITKTASLVIEPPTDPSGDIGGIMLDLTSEALAGRTITLRRTASSDPSPKGIVVDQDRYWIAGVTTAEIDGVIARIVRDRETFRSHLRYLDIRYGFDGITARLFIAVKKIKELTLAADNNSTITAVRLRDGADTLELNNLRDVTWWYPSAAGEFNASTVKPLSFKTKQMTTEISLTDLQSLTSAAGKVEIVLKNGETHSGVINMETRKPFAITGKLMTAYAGFPAVACFVLSSITSLEMR